MVLLFFTLLSGCNDKGVDTSAPGLDPACLELEPAATGEPALVFTGDRPSNLLVLSIDTLNVSRLPRYGGAADADTLTAMMAEGVTLDNHFTCAPWTFPGVLCSLSGQYNTELGYIPTVYEGVPRPAPADALFLQDWLKEQGYTSGLVSANAYLSSANNVGTDYDIEIPQTGFPAISVLTTSRDMMDELWALADGSPWYAHIHLLDPHAPYTPPEAYLTEFAELSKGFPFDLLSPTGVGDFSRAFDALEPSVRVWGQELVTFLYDAEIAYLDDQVAEFLAEMDAAGALDDTLVVFFSDHGEQLFEHGDAGHGISLYNGELGGLASFWMKDGGLTAASWTGPTDQRDLVPTIFDALGLPEQPEWTGRIAGTAAPDRALMGLRFHGETSSQSIIRSGNKMIYNWGAAPLYFDLTTDYSEITDRFDIANEQDACDWAAISAQSQEIVRLYPEFADSVSGGTP